MEITNEILMLTIKDNEGKDVPKPKAQYGEADYIMQRNNAKGKCIILFGLRPDKFNRIYGCTIT